MQSLSSICNEIKGCKKCDLYFSRKTAVCGVGLQFADTLVLGEAPGSTEDQTGVPFVGRSGKLLDKMLKDTNMPRESVYISNAVRCRPKIGRAPKITEIRKCSPFLKDEMDLIEPKFIIPMGNSALKSLGFVLKIDFGRISEAWKNIYQIDEMFIFPQFHPAAILRNPKLFHTMKNRFDLIRDFRKEYRNNKTREYMSEKYGIIKIS
ncbi:uracil-DNA glycosylase [Oxyplasma meridianum]|uniref:Type-4 uracil-DNA glycosylase n=1 Tax=Oxyplasma meridianum TaxID=3073602 RepID=A0AAX4NI64_9ARCH